MPIRPCKVSFTDRNGTHTADVDAESVYEAAVLALKAFQSKRWSRGPSRNAVLNIEVQVPRTFRVTVKDVLEWLYSTRGTTPQQERRKYLRNLLADDRH